MTMKGPFFVKEETLAEHAERMYDALDDLAAHGPKILELAKAADVISGNRQAGAVASFENYLTEARQLMRDIQSAQRQKGVRRVKYRRKAQEPEPERPANLLGAVTFALILSRCGQQGAEDVRWSEEIKPPETADFFATEAIFVICNSGMKAKTARGIFDRVMGSLRGGGSASDVFGHKGKSKAMDEIWNDRSALFEAYKVLTDDDSRLEWISKLPFIGGITKYHLAKNFGVDCPKPDVHLERLAKVSGETVFEMCSRLSRETGYRKATIDVVLWRASAFGVIDSKTGEFTGKFLD